MKRAILFMLIFLSGLPLNAKEIGDLHREIEAAFPGKIFGVSGGKGTIQRVDFTPAATTKDKSDIQTFVASYDWSKPGQQELDAEIEKKLSALANDKSLTDAEYQAIKIKLTRAQKMSEPSEKESKYNEAKALEPVKK